jgi:hypothetical protein
MSHCPKYLNVRLVYFILVSVLGFFGACNSHGAIIRMDYSGVVLSYLAAESGSYLSDAGSERPALAGTLFSGYVIYSVDGAEYTTATINEYGQPVAQAYSNSGCGILVNGNCQLNYGGDLPVVLDYQLSFRGMVYGPLPTSLGFSDESRRINQSAGGAPSGEVWGVHRNQFQYVISGDPDGGDYNIALRRRNLNIGVFIAGDGLLEYPSANLEQGFLFSVLPFYQRNFIFMNLDPLSTACVAGSNCTGQYGPGSFDIRGSLTSVSFRTIPEPDSSALLLLAFGTAALVRRRVH